MKDFWADGSCCVSSRDDIYICLFVFGATAPQWAKTSSFTRFLDHTHDAPQSVRPLWTRDQLVAEIST